MWERLDAAAEQQAEWDERMADEAEARGISIDEVEAEWEERREAAEEARAEAMAEARAGW